MSVPDVTTGVREKAKEVGAGMLKARDDIERQNAKRPQLTDAGKIFNTLGNTDLNPFGRALEKWLKGIQATSILGGNVDVTIDVPLDPNEIDNKQKPVV